MLRVVAMTARSSGAGGKRGIGRKVARGGGEAGVEFDPTKAADEPGTPARKNRAMPAPGVPMSAEEYERLKREAETARTPPSPRRQEDPATKK